MTNRPRIPLVDLSPIPISPLKEAGYSFLEQQSQVHTTSRATTKLKAFARIKQQVHERHQYLLWDPRVWNIDQTKPNNLSPFIAADLWSYDLGW